MGVFSGGFPADSFTVAGDPGAIEEAARRYLALSDAASASRGAVGALDSSRWQGDEGDTFRASAAAFLDPLSTTRDAFVRATHALQTFASFLRNAQAEMATLARIAETDWTAMQSADAAVAAHMYTNAGVDVSDTSTRVDVGAVEKFQADDAHLRSAAASAHEAWDADLGAAQGIRDGVEQAAQRAGAAIRAAGDMSPTAGQNWFERHLETTGSRLDAHGAPVRDRIGEHAQVIRTAGEWSANVGKAATALGAGLAVLGVLGIPETGGLSVLAELPAGALIAGGSALWSGGDIAQAAADWGEKKIDGRQLIVRGAIAGATGLLAGVAAKGAVKIGEKFLPGVLEKLKRAVVGDKRPAQKWAPEQHSEFTGEGAHIDRVAPIVRHHNDVTFHLDPATGRTLMVTGVLRRHTLGLRRSQKEMEDQAAARVRHGDVGGHIIAHRFLQDAGLRNLFSQEKNFNGSAYKKMENEWAAWIDHGMEVHPRIRLQPAGQVRPTNIAVEYEVRDPRTGNLVFGNYDVNFRNASGQVFERVPTVEMSRWIERAACP